MSHKKKHPKPYGAPEEPYRKIVEPVTTPYAVGIRDAGTVTTHPAFGQIGAFRGSGGAILHGSDFQHSNYISLRIWTGKLHRDLSRDWFHSERELIEIEMSEAQWATLVSSPGMGNGVPCTLRHVGGEVIPGLPDPKQRGQQFSDEADKTMAKVTERLYRLKESLESLGLPKGKTAAIREELRHALMDLEANLPFVAKQFSKHIEGEVAKAQIEVEGHILMKLARAGMAAVAGEQPLLRLPAPPAEE